ncbi:DUF6798 domain-containing protein [Ruegeria sp.]|uniref:DUF6798 domain-containing protein n=1 Tax=Ruegeria sp. TaxID=1879320 RepID=UPI00231F157D|nr:DUF6798 domain-containing protein [Ruegeria sp.]MDA7964141.1 hypothetical protein [Ruegeria sp.]
MGLMTADRAQPEPGPAQIVLLLALMSLLPLVGAQFGHGNQVEQLPIVARLVDPSAMAGDFYTDHAAGFGPRIYYARVLAWLHGVLPMPVIMHGLMCLFAFVLGGVTYLGARQIVGAGVMGGLLAAALAITNGSFSLGLAGYLRFDSFQPANIAIALALGGVVLMFAGRPWLAVIGFAAAAMMHPLIGVEIAAIAFAAIGVTRLISLGDQTLVRALAPLIGAGLAFGAAIWLFWVWPAPAPEGVPLSDAAFFDILIRFRAPHHYLGSEFYRRSWVEAGLFVATTLIILVWLTRRSDMPNGTGLAVICLIVLATCAASLWFTDVQHSRVWATAQVFRMLMVVKWVGFLLLSRLVADLYAKDRTLALACALMLLLASADAQPYAIVVVLVAMLAATLVRRLLAGQAAGVVIWLGLGLGVVLSAALAWRYGIPVQSLRGVLAFALIALVLLPWLRRGLVLAVILGLTAPAVSIVLRPAGTSYSWLDHQDAAAQIARQAGQLSPEGAIWAVPPDQERFRLLSGRGVVVSFTAIPFDDAGLGNWHQRLEALYGPFSKNGFGALQEMRAAHRANTEWIATAQGYGATHAVLYADTPWDGPMLYENEKFKAVALGAP